MRQYNKRHPCLLGLCAGA